MWGMKHRVDEAGARILLKKQNMPHSGIHSPYVIKNDVARG